MAIIKQISQYDNGNWSNPYDIGANAENISLNKIEGLDSTDVQSALLELKQNIDEYNVLHFNEDGILLPESGGLGFNPNGTPTPNSTANILMYDNISNQLKYGNLSASHIPTLTVDSIPALNASKITSGSLAVERGGTGASSTKAITANLASTLAAHALSSTIGVSGILPPERGGLGMTGNIHSLDVKGYFSNGLSSGAHPMKVNSAMLYYWGRFAILTIELVPAKTFSFKTGYAYVGAEKNVRFSKAFPYGPYTQCIDINSGTQKNTIGTWALDTGTAASTKDSKGNTTYYGIRWCSRVTFANTTFTSNSTDDKITIRFRYLMRNIPPQ